MWVSVVARCDGAANVDAGCHDAGVGQSQGATWPLETVRNDEKVT